MLLSSYIPLLLTLPMVLSRDVHDTSYGGVCTSLCDRKDGTDYYWCEQQMYGTSGWDYCSPREGYDYKNKLCKTPCETKGTSYEWCKVHDESFGYCGHVTEEFEKSFTRYGAQCLDNCVLKNDYFQCYFQKGSSNEYCSPSNNVTRKGEPCRKDHPCDLYDKQYYWCYTDNSNWDYCGEIIGDCEKPSYGPNTRKVICTITGRENIQVLTAVEDLTLTRPSRDQFIDASAIINLIDTKTCFTGNNRAIYNHNSIGLFLKITSESNGFKYINIQLQTDGNKQGQSTIAQVIFPEDVETKRYYRYIRRALHTSLRSAYHGDPVQVTITKERI
ncbi:hypothetical protein FKM82_015974 [Ascaphus truei]